MTPEPTLGEILGAVLSSLPIMAAPCIDATSAQVISASYLAREIADALAVPFPQVWRSMCRVPDNMLNLLESPQGWTALGGFVAGDLGISPPDILPTIH